MNVNIPWKNSTRVLATVLALVLCGLPQLTYADDHPGEDLPRFRYAFEVTADTP